MMRLARLTIQRLMLLVAMVAVLVALERIRWRFPLLLLGPFVGAVAHLARGGNGILGGVLSGSAAWAVSGVIEFAIYDNSAGNRIQYGLRQQAVGLLVFTAIGAVVGLIIGASVGRRPRASS